MIWNKTTHHFLNLNFFVESFFKKNGRKRYCLFFFSMKVTYSVFFVLFLKKCFGNKVSLLVRLWIEKNTSRRILKKKNKASSGFDSKISQRVIFCIEKKVNTSDFELKFFRHVWFQKNLQTKNHVLFFSSVKTTYFAFSSF